jgi:hypothetical protein
MTDIDRQNYDSFSSRLHCVDFTADPMLNIELWHSLTAFEDHVHGVGVQYTRITSDLEFKPQPCQVPGVRQHAGLDVYYYVLTWDKLRKIYCEIKSVLRRVRERNPAVPAAFWQELRMLSRGAEHLFSEVGIAARNEYEHPSLKPYAVGNIIMWGSMTVDASGDIVAHVGATTFATVKKEHCKRLRELRTDLIDLFIKYFSQKPLTKELIRVRTYIEENIGPIAEELKQLRDDGNTAGFNASLHRLIMHDLYLGAEGVALVPSARDRLYSLLVEETPEPPDRSFE